jgi:SDR family mycofactocin-dependent oxidoreductase
VTGKLAGRVALITGAARGLGRSHALRLAEEGADIVAVDICAPVASVPYPATTPADLERTVQLVSSCGRQCLAIQADVRDYAMMEDVTAAALRDFGHLDIIVANAGIASFGPVWELRPEQWQDMIAVNLTGAFNTIRPALPAMITAGSGGSIILISSVAGLAAFPNVAHYNAAKHGVTGLMRSLSVELAQFGIRANSVHPTTADTPMVHNQAFYSLAGATTEEEAAHAFRKSNALPVPWVGAGDVSSAVLWLASDESRYVTGIALPVDAGALQPFRLPHPA